MSEWLIDKSAFVRLGGSPDADEWANRISRGLVRVSSITRLEIGFSAKSGDDFDQMFDSPPLSYMPVVYVTPAIENRAFEMQGLLAQKGLHRAPSIPDLLIAATAELSKLIVLHEDKDFNIIASISGQPLQVLLYES